MVQTFSGGGDCCLIPMADRVDLQSVDYRPKERTWATPASVFPGNLLVPIHCELGTIARNPLLARCWLLPANQSLTAKAQRTQRETARGWISDRAICCIVLEPTLAKMQQDSHCDKPPASKASGRWLRRMQAIQPHR